MVSSETGRILVVDDDPTVAEVVARYLMRDGHEVDCVADGLAALRLAAESLPTWSFSTSCCPASTVSKCVGASANAGLYPSSC